MIKLYTFCLFFFMSISFSQGKWTWISPLPQGNTLNSIQNLGNNKIIAIGDYGTILLSSDLGENWKEIYSGTTESLLTINFLNEKIGFAAGNKEIIIKTSDGGNTWTSISGPNYDNNLNHMQFIDDTLGYAYGINMYYKTTDAGNSWNKLIDNKFYTGFAWFLNKKVGVGFSNGNLIGIVRTTDAGGNWIKVHSAYSIRDIVFPSPSTGYFIHYADTTGIGFKTTDSGKTFTRMYAPLLHQGLHSVSFTDDDNGYIGGESDYILHTSNGGENWAVQYKGKNYSANGINGIQAINKSTAIAVGHEGLILKTTDSGTSWDRKTLGFEDNIIGVNFFNNKVGIAYGDNGLIIRTSDSGKTWDTFYSEQHLCLRDASLFSSSIIYIAGNNKLLKSTDTGITWSVDSVDIPGSYIQSIHFLNENNWYILVWEGNYGNAFLMHSTDGGSHWNQKFLTGWYLSKLRFLTPQLGLAIGEYGYIQRTTDGGITWNARSGGKHLYNMFIQDSLNVILTGSESRISKSTDGGQTWYKVNGQNEESNYLYAVSFMDKKNGIAVGTKPLKTTDGGETWFFDNWQNTNQIFGAWYLPHNSIIAVGQSGTILRYSDEQLLDVTNQLTPAVSFNLYQNYPNPFNSSTKIKYSVPASGMVQIKLYNVLGQEVTELVNKFTETGIYEIDFNAYKLPGGVYLYKLQSGSYSEIKKMILLK